MKQLIEEQREEYVRIASYTNEYGYLHKIPKYEDVWNWHKQSLKQFIDELIERESEIVSTMEDYYPQFKFRMGLISGKNETISHLKELKEQLG